MFRRLLAAGLLHPGFRLLPRAAHQAAWLAAAAVSVATRQLPVARGSPAQALLAIGFAIRMAVDLASLSVNYPHVGPLHVLNTWVHLQVADLSACLAKVHGFAAALAGAPALGDGSTWFRTAGWVPATGAQSAEARGDRWHVRVATREADGVEAALQRAAGHGGSAAGRRSRGTTAGVTYAVGLWWDPAGSCAAAAPLLAATGAFGAIFLLALLRLLQASRQLPSGPLSALRPVDVELAAAADAAAALLVAALACAGWLLLLCAALLMGGYQSKLKLGAGGKAVLLLCGGGLGCVFAAGVAWL